MSFLGSGSSPKSNEDIKTALLQQVQQEQAMNNARALIGKINENCFDACVPAPGSSLSSKETACMSSCMDKYINMWNTVSRTYMHRMNEERKKMGGDVAGLSM
ncbi:Mitochondrial import inner membrane translocase subunit tim13 [Penicillium rolfsii]|nr:Mitochondrial import inner membrane translocase subunit tim13 [Penicillium rolfsii]